MSQSYDPLVMIKDLNQSYEWQLSETLDNQQLEALLAEHINEWIRTDFQRLIQFLYRIDINESRLKLLLEENTEEDTGHLLARLVLERQWQKIQTRRQFTQDAAGSEEERW